VDKVKGFIQAQMNKLRNKGVVAYSKAWFYVERVKFTATNKINSNRKIAFALLTLLITGVSVYLSNLAHDEVLIRLTDTRIASIQNILLGLGGAFIGATAITFSLVMFAMQVNVERMPHGLFRRFNSDKQLLLVFFVSFTMASAIMALSIVDKKEWMLSTIVLSFWFSLGVLVSFLYTYRRALDLISPTRQLAFIQLDLDRYFNKTDKRVKRAAPLFLINNDGGTSTHDMPRFLYYKANPDWYSPVLNAILHCVSYSRRYAEQGDHEVCSHALSAIVMINTNYIQHKGKTFFADSPFINNLESHDPVFSKTLEHLRQNIQLGLSKGDELFVQATFRTFAGLAEIYYNIDYSVDHPTKSHGRLAVGYLSSSVELAVPHQLVDVCMEGARLLGRMGVYMINYEDYENIPYVAEKIALFSIASSVNKKFDPLTAEGVEQLANISFELIRSSKSNIRYPVREIRSDIKQIVEYALKEKELGFSKPHNHKLAGYYMSTSPSGLAGRLCDLVNALLKLDEDNENGQRIIRNLSEWSDQIYSHDKDVLLMAIDKKSHLSFDVINWITTVSEILMTASSADCCSDHYRDEIRNNAAWLISVLDWIPDDIETVQYVENFQFTETLFEFAQQAYLRECTKIYDKVKDILFKWSIKAGKYQTGWGVLQEGIKALVVLSIKDGNGFAELETKLQEIVAQADVPQELLNQAARDLSEEANNFHGYPYKLRAIKRAMGEVDNNDLTTALKNLANILSP
jgi:hypothetical protein